MIEYPHFGSIGAKIGFGYDFGGHFTLRANLLGDIAVSKAALS